jgi:hypothetical protein
MLLPPLSCGRHGIAPGLAQIAQQSSFTKRDESAGDKPYKTILLLVQGG